MKPVYLYKYQPFSIQCIENLKNQVIYFGSPAQFNDPFDCALTPGIKELTNEDIEEIRHHILTNQNYGDLAKAELKGRTIEQLRNSYERISKENLDETIQLFREQKGVSCFSERNDNLLMWSHYGDHHRGFCLEFDTSSEVFAKVQQVTYTDQIPSFDPKPSFFGVVSDKVTRILCTKSVDWAYEKEWRVLHSVQGTKYGYSSQTLTGVYFGTKASEAMIAVIILFLMNQNSNIKFYKGKQSLTKFRVEFDQVTYTPHLEAERLGLYPRDNS